LLSCALEALGRVGFQMSLKEKEEEEGRRRKMRRKRRRESRNRGGLVNFLIHSMKSSLGIFVPLLFV
jgi:hypothetical protein